MLPPTQRPWPADVQQCPPTPVFVVGENSTTPVTPAPTTFTLVDLTPGVTVFPASTYNSWSIVVLQGTIDINGVTALPVGYSESHAADVGAVIANSYTVVVNAGGRAIASVGEY